MIRIKTQNILIFLCVILTITSGVLLFDRYFPVIPNIGSGERKQEVERFIRNQSLYSLPTGEKVVQGELKGIVASLDDKYSEYQTVEEQKRFQDSVNQRYVGIGVKFENKDGNLVAAKIIDNSPAKSVGIMIGDVLKQVNDSSVDNFNDTSEVINSIRGDVDTTVRIIIQRNNQEMSFVITRKRVENDLVTFEIQNQVAIITISSFGQGLGSKMTEIMKTINNSNPQIKAMIVDVRGNSGGLLDEAVVVMSCFVKPETVVVKEKSRYGSLELKTKDQGQLLPNTPIYLLTDGGTASASEILVGALQDLSGAKSVGQKTYGKGVVQKLFQLQGGDTLKLTVSEWLTPKNRQIDKKGIDPDIKVKVKDNSFAVAMEEIKKIP